jgi:hypothetical protein
VMKTEDQAFAATGTRGQRCCRTSATARSKVLLVALAASCSRKE